jgi:hypothetical protein
MMTRVRVVQRADGQVSVIRPSTPDLADDQFDEVCTFIIERSAETQIPLVGLPYVDIDESALPSRTAPCPDDGCDAEHYVRDQWVLQDGIVAVDGTIPNAHRALDHAERAMGALLDADVPDLAEVLRLQRHMQRLAPLTHGGPHEAVRAELERHQKIRRAR